MRDRPSDTAHRRAAALKLGRALLPGELVHHLDEDKANQAPTNLDVSVGRGAHTAAHNRGRGLSKVRAALRSFKEGRKVY